MKTTDEALQTFGRMLDEARKKTGITIDELCAEAHTSKSSYNAV